LLDFDSTLMVTVTMSLAANVQPLSVTLCSVQVVAEAGRTDTDVAQAVPALSRTVISMSLFAAEFESAYTQILKVPKPDA
jgi:hypothetical protein